MGESSFKKTHPHLKYLRRVGFIFFSFWWFFFNEGQEHLGKIIRPNAVEYNKKAEMCG